MQGATPSQDVPEGRGSADEDGPADRGGRRVDALKTGSEAGDAHVPAATRRSVPVGGPATGVSSTGRVHAATAGGGTATLEREEPRAELRVRQAAGFTAGVLGMAVTAVFLHVGKTLLGLVRR